VDRRPRLNNDPELAATTFAVIDFEATTPAGRRPEPIDVAIIQIRLDSGRWAEAGRFSKLMCPPPHAPVTPFDTAQTGITPQMTATAEPAAVVLAELDATFPGDQPRLLVAHHASTEAGILHDYRDHCPRLAHTDLLDTVRLARVLYPHLPSHKLDTLLAYLGIPQPPGRHRALPDVQATAHVFCEMLAYADKSLTWASLRDLRRAGLVVAKANRPQQDGLFDLETLS
jgi:DNA polymerase III epsilon subunit-like protein